MGDGGFVEVFLSLVEAVCDNLAAAGVLVVDGRISPESRPVVSSQ